MIINTNISALNTYNMLTRNENAIAKNLQKLSSGYRINSAGDDAAGLAISEKMRALTTGTNRAISNSREGMGLIQTGEGALQEVQDMLGRIKSLAVQSANGTYDDAIDRANLQKELSALRTEIDRIASSANFNGVALFQNEGFETEGGRLPDIFNSHSIEGMSLEEALSDRSGPLKNIIFTNVTYEYDATQTGSGSSELNVNDYSELANTLQNSIVPQAVQAITDTYSAFKYLNGSSIGIGLNLYNEDSTTLAYVSVRPADVTTNGEDYFCKSLEYTLAVNLHAVGDLSVAANRSALEQTIAHEMIHAFMDEATTVGMTGLAPDSYEQSNMFPSWFVEGMAQTASGPGNWVRSGGALGITPSSSNAQITAALQDEDNKLGSGTSASEYGSGYLACMYLGYLANGATANMSDPEAAADGIADGLSEILAQLIHDGKSLQAVISDVTGGKYTTIAAFENGFAADQDAVAFIKKLAEYTTTDDGSAKQNVGGGVVSGSLSNKNPLSDSTVTDLALFKLDKNNSVVKNTYPNDVNVLSGGSATGSGEAPFEGSGESSGTGGSGSGGDTPSGPSEPSDPGGPSGPSGPSTPPSGPNTPTGPTGPIQNSSKSIVLQVGASTGDTFEIQKFYLSREALGLDQLDISTQDAAKGSIEKVDWMINRVSEVRGSYGALQNGLEHLVNSLGIGVENLTSAESRIRDADIAEEMADYTKNSILIQASQAMLAQANSRPQGVLRLLH